MRKQILILGLLPLALMQFTYAQESKSDSIESRKGISPSRSHGNVRESLPSYGSSCL